MLDQRLTMKNHFEGMTLERFSYDDFECTRKKLIDEVSAVLTKEDKEFLISFCELKPQWNIYDFEKFPAVQWKMSHLKN